MNNNNHINITTSGTVNNVAYSDDDGKDFMGIQDASNLSINPGATIWICNYLGDLSDLTQVQGPPLPVVSNLATVFGGPDYAGSAAESLTWGGMAGGAESEIDYMFNDSGNWTEASSSSGAGWQQGYALLSTAYPEEGGQYTYQVRQYVNAATIPITGYSKFAQIDMGVYPFAPPYNTLTNVPLSPTSAQLLWPEASEGETDQLLQWSTDGFTTIAGSATVLMDATGFTLTALTPNTHYSVRLAERKSGAPDSLWAAGDVYTPAIPSVSITAVQNAAELGPDNHPQDGYFEITRSGLPVDSLTVSIDLSGTAVLGTQYVTDAGDGSPVQVTFPVGVTAVMLEVEPSQGGPGDPGGTVTATVEPLGGATIANGSATLNIAGMPTLQDVIVIDQRFAQNRITSDQTDPAAQIYVQQQANGVAWINISANITPAGAGHVLWDVVGPTSSATGMVHDFSAGAANVSLKPTADNTDFLVNVGVDRNGNGTLDADEIQQTITVHVYSIKITDVVSDQFPGIQQNSLWGNAGVGVGKNPPLKTYIMMGTDTSDIARVVVDYTSTGDVPPNLTFALGPASSSATFTGSVTSSPGSVLLMVPASSNPNISDEPNIVKYGLDLNGDGLLSSTEVIATDPRELRIIDQAVSRVAVNALNDLENVWSLGGLSAAANFMFSFLNDFAPAGAANSTVSFSSFTDPTMARPMHHHVGVAYSPTGQITMDLAKFSSTSSLAADIAMNAGITGRVVNLMTAVAPAVLAKMTADNSAGEWFTWTPGYTSVRLIGPDLFLSIGDAALSGIKVYAYVQRARNGEIFTNNISISGTLSDIADFNWDFEQPFTSLVRLAVEAQARYNRTGDAGHVFETQVQLNNWTGLSWDITHNEEAVYS